MVAILERAVADPKHLEQHVRAFVQAFWDANDRLGEEWLPYGSPENDALNDLGHDLQDYEPPTRFPEPTLIHDADALRRISEALLLVKRRNADDKAGAV